MSLDGFLIIIRECSIMKRTEGYFRGKNDFELFFQGWIPEKPRATLVVTHGLGEHSDCYLRVVEGLKHLDVEIYCWDLRGHGRSEGKRGVIKNFQVFSDDQKIFIDFLRANSGQKPLGLISHSMGGLVTLNTLLEYSNLDVKTAIFSSPLLGVAVEVPAIKKTAARYLAEFLPSLTMWNEIPDKNLTHEKKIIEEFRKDPLRHDRISSKLYLEMTECTEKIKKLGHRISLPAFFQLSGKDLVVSTPSTQEFFKTIASPKKSLKVYESSYHEIYNDIERKTCFEDASVWLQETLLS